MAEIREQIVRLTIDGDETKAEVIGTLTRCKDCKHKDADDGFCKGRGWPMQLVPDDGFCDKGKRSENGWRWRNENSN